MHQQQTKHKPHATAEQQMDFLILLALVPMAVTAVAVLVAMPW